MRGGSLGEGEGRKEEGSFDASEGEVAFLLFLFAQ